MTPRLGRLALVLALSLQPMLASAAEIGKGPLSLPPTRVEATMPGFPTVEAWTVPGVVATPAPGAEAGSQPGAQSALSAAAGQIEAGRAAEAQGAPAEGSAGFSVSQGLFDGASFEPGFEPASAKAGPALEAGAEDDEALASRSGASERPSLGGFPLSIRGALLAIDPARAIYGTARVVRDTPKKKGQRKNGSEIYWEAYRKGVEIDVFSGGGNVFGRPTKITYAVTKPISKMSKDDFKGLVPAVQLQLPIKELRQKLVERLDATRIAFRGWDNPVTVDSRVRVIKFQSYIDLYKEVHGKNAVPEPEPVVEREPLHIRAEGKLANLTRFPPRLVFLDVDSLEKALSPVQLADMAELQRTGVYFVAFSRRPYDAPGGMRDLLVKNMSGSQLTAQMPNRFLAVTDDGAVVSKMRKDGTIVPLDAQRFSPTELDVMQDAAQKSLESAGIKPGDVSERKQGPIFVESQRWNPFKREPKAAPRDPRVRYELIFPNDAGFKLETWRLSFERRLREQGIPAVGHVTRLEDGRFSYSVQKTDLMGSLDRVYRHLGDEFGMYATPTKSDIAVLSDDAALRSVNPLLDIAKLTDLKGTTRFENVLGLILGEAREGGKKGSASRIISFVGYRERYMSEFIIAQDAAEQNINFFSGHMVHAANDWLISNLQHGVVPTPQAYETHLRERWDRGLREPKAVGIPKGALNEQLLDASVERALQMYKHVVAAHNRGEIIVGSEIPNFMIIKAFKKGADGVLKERYIVHTIFDFIAIRPTYVDAQGRKHGIQVTYDFKTGPAKSVQKLEKDDQVLTYSLFAHERWVGQPFPVPYMSGDDSYIIDDNVIEYIYNLVQKPTVDPYMREKQRRRIPRIFEAIARTEAKLMGVTADGRPKETKKKGAAAPQPKGPKVKIDKSRPAEAGFETLTLPRTVPGLKIKREFAQKIVAGKKKIEYRTMSTNPKPFVAIIQTFTDDEPGRPAEVVGFARIEKVTQGDGQYQWHLSHVTPVAPYVVPNNKAGTVIWVKDVPVQGPKKLKP